MALTEREQGCRETTAGLGKRPPSLRYGTDELAAAADEDGRSAGHRYYWLLLAEGYLNRRLFGDMLRRIWALPVPGG